MRRKTRSKVKKGIIIAGISISIVLIVLGIVLIIKLNKKPYISYDDGLTSKNYFSQITINLANKEVKRDDKTTSLSEEFEISKEREDLAFSSQEEMQNLLSDSVFEISQDNQIFTIKNNYQTKTLIVQADEIKEKVDGEEVTKISQDLYVLKFYSEKLTKAMYKYYMQQSYIKNIFLDEIFIDQPINDISQTMYGQTEIELYNHNSLGPITMGLDNYHKIIAENGNPSEIVISTIGYGFDLNNQVFNGRIDDNYYNFILNNNTIKETIPQGSRIAEVIVDSTTQNIKLMPLVVVTEEGYVSLSSIVQAISYGVAKSDVICYELINKKHEAIDLALENAFKENKPVCSVCKNDTENYPAIHGMTIATSSIDRQNIIADYSGKGEFIDFTAPSTDVKEIFNSNSTISRWSGPQYSNAQISSVIALIKTYEKNATILDIYNFLRNYSIDLGENGKDQYYGYGCPQFSNITISDIDKKAPEIKEITYENETWETLKQAKIIANDNIRIKSWAITKNETEPSNEEWKVLEEVTPNLDVTTDIIENGKYYIWIQDTAGNKTSKDIQVDKVDNTPPQIAYTINQDTLSSGYVTVTVTAEDSQSGLYDSPFSWDQMTWSQENSTRTFKENGRYKVYAVDKLGNNGELEILIDCFPQEGTYELGEGDIISSVYVSADWNGDTNNNVRIELNKNINIVAWQFTDFNYIPTDFVQVENVTNTQEQNQEVPSQETLPNDNTSDDIPKNVVINTNTIRNFTRNSNTTNTNTDNGTPTTREQTQDRTEPIVINKQLNINVTYYLWIKDSSGNIRFQTLKIGKVII